MVSIPKRDFTEFRAYSYRLLVPTCNLFQSLKGILRNLEPVTRALSAQDALFQSLKGILRNLESFCFKYLGSFGVKFQSLKGILRNLEFLSSNTIAIRVYVSIPKRDFTEFRGFGCEQLLTCNCFNP